MSRPPTYLLALLVLLTIGACAESELALPGGLDASGIPDAGSTPDADPRDTGTPPPTPDVGAEPDAAPDSSAPGRCTRDEDCPGAQTCDVLAATCADPPTSTCGDGVCDPDETCSDCLDCACGDNATCSFGVCECDDVCAVGQDQCAGDQIQSCSTDADGCAQLDAPRDCPSGVCSNGACCADSCGLRECGMDACGNPCGTCSSSCVNGYCTRQLVVNYVQTSCSADCQDVFDPTDPYIELFIGGQSFDRDKGERDRCGSTLTAQGWTVGGATRTFSSVELRSVRVEVKDQDRTSSDDVCAEWSRVDLSAPGTVDITSPDGKVTVSFTTTL
jgi:hypothetical protein